MALLRGGLAIVFMATNTVIWATLCYLMALIRLVQPTDRGRTRWAARMNVIIDGWVSCNRWMFRLLLPTRFDVRGLEGLHRGEWYLLLSNHQSWTDIVVLQAVFRHHVPPLKFFTKAQLVWIPFLGQAMWALDFPFMRRHSKEYLERHPEQKGRDLETTREKCERFRPTPTSIIIFPEGTRNTPVKHLAQESPHRHLLRPRAGGVGFVLGAMGDQLNALIDVSLAYPDGIPTFWEFLSGRVREVIVDVQHRDLDPQLQGGDYIRDEAYRERIQLWITDLWEAKDARIAGLLAAGEPDRDAAGPDRSA